MSRLRRLLCRVFGYCQHQYEPALDPLVARFDRIEREMDRERKQWMPRDIYRIR